MRLDLKSVLREIIVVNKTIPNQRSIQAYINRIADSERREEAARLLELISRISGEKPVMWGTSIIGFGEYTYYNSKKKPLTWCPIGLSCRQKTQTIYFTRGLPDMECTIPTNWPNLGKYKFGKSCFHMRQLSDVRLDDLASMIGFAWRESQTSPNPIYY